MSKELKLRSYLTSLFLGSLLGTTNVLAQGTGYHADGGGTRVIYQNQLGMPSPSSTYIGPGTVSPTARGAAGGNPNLPRVNLGSNVGTAGDSTYQTTEIKGAGQTMEANSNIHPEMMRNRQRRQTSGSAPTQYVKVRRGNRYYYVPASQAPQTLTPQQQGLHQYIPPQGAATYGD